MFQTRWFKALLTFCTLLLVVAACIEIYARLANRGRRIVEAHPVDARIEISNPPTWLTRGIVQNLLNEAYQYAQKNKANYDRSRDVLDSSILKEMAELYTGGTAVGGETDSRQVIGYNAWISRITEVRRVVAKDKSQQTIEIYADWREPAAWIRVDMPGQVAAGTAPAATSASQLLVAPAAMSATAAALPVKSVFYLIDAEGTRLPMDYQSADRTRSGLMTITGIDLPEVDGKPAVPDPGRRWTASGGGAIGEDLGAALKLATTLEKERFAGQIDAIDAANYKGRRDPRAAWMVLDTVWKTADGTGSGPCIVDWGRPIGEEKYYEVQAAVKIRRLGELYQTYHRIDAGRDYVDIRMDMTVGPRIASQGPDADVPAVHG